MSRRTRATCRGGRIINVANMPVPGVSTTGRGRDEVDLPIPMLNIGRGKRASLDPYIQWNVLKNSTNKIAIHSFITVSEEEAKKILEAGLSNVGSPKRLSSIHMALDYFESSTDAEFYVQKVIECLLKSPAFIEEFTMSYTLITAMKKQGEVVKQLMFTKLETVFKDMQILMEDSNNIQDSTVNEKVRNFCDLFGQMYFRFRVDLNSGTLGRIDFFSGPLLHCMAYLVRVKGQQELKLFSKLLALNLSALKELYPGKPGINELKMCVRQELYNCKKSVEDPKKFAWLMLGFEMLSSPNWNKEVKRDMFYQKELQQDWSDMPKIPVKMLADIPAHVTISHMDKLNINLNEYFLHSFDGK